MARTTSLARSPRTGTRTAPTGRLPLRFEVLEDRTMPSFSFPLSGTAWREFGPRNIAAQPGGLPPGQGSSSPGNIPSTGRTVGVVTDPTNPDIAYIAAAGGGVAKTTDGGLTWTHLTDRLPASTPGLIEDYRSLSMGAITLGKFNPNRVYAGEGEPNFSGDSYPGNGVLISPDGGATWSLNTGPGNAFVGSTISRIITAKNPAAPTDATKELVFVAIQSGIGSNAGIYRSTDAGATFVKVSGRLNTDNGVDPTAAVTDFQIDPTNPNIGYLAIGSPGGAPPASYALNGIYRTTNLLSATPTAAGAAGTEWTVAFGGNGSFIPGSLLGRIEFVVAPSSPSVLYAVVSDGIGDAVRGVYRSSSSGTNWQQFVNMPPFLIAQGFYNMGIAVDPLNENRLVLVGTNQAGNTAAEIAITENALAADAGGGTSAVIWSGIGLDATGEGPHVDLHSATFGPRTNPADARSSRLWVTSDGGVFRTDSIFDGPNPGTVAVDWVSANGTPGPNALNVTQYVGIGLHPSTDGLIIGGTQDNGVQRFEDTGNPATSWVWPEVDGGDGGDVIYDSVNPNIVYHTAPYNGRWVQKSTDGGKTWALASTGLTGNALFYPPIKMDPSQSNRLFLGLDKLMETTNSAGSWAKFNNDLDFVTGRTGLAGPAVISAIGIGRFTPNVVYVAVNTRYADNSVFPSGPAIYKVDVAGADNGSWLNTTIGEPSWHDISPIFAGAGNTSTARGVAGYAGDPLRPITGAATFPIPNSLNGTITSIAVDPYGNNSDIVYITTSAREIYKTFNGGVTWTKVGLTGLPAGLTQQEFNDIELNPYKLTVNGQSDDFLYVATNIGVYQLQNPTLPTAANTWIRLGGDSQPDARVEDIEVNSSLGILASGTHGRGVWEISIEPYVSGIAYQDFNGNGIQDPGDTPINDLRIIATRLSGNGAPAEAFTTRTLANGFYAFRSLENETYLVNTDPSALNGSWQNTQPDRQFTVTPTFTDYSSDLGNFKRTTISGVKFSDINGNGVRDVGEPGVAGWVFELRNSVTNAVVQTATTDANGNFTFTNVGVLQDRTVFNPVTGYTVIPWRVREVGQTGWIQTTANPADITLTSGTPFAGLSFGNFQFATINGVKFEDINGDGIRQPAEPLLQNWKIVLLNALTNVPISTATTDAVGAYSFTGLGIGTYRLRETQQAGWVQTTANPADIVAQGSTSVTANFGNFQTTSISGVVYEDVNGNGSRQGTENNLILGAVVSLIDPSNNTVIQTATTNNLGQYTFTGIGPIQRPGNAVPYNLRVTAPGTFAQTTPSPAIILTSNTPVVNQQLGVFTRTTVSGFAFEDINGDGVRQVNEPGLNAGSIALLNSATQAQVQTTLTDANGNFVFTGVAPIVTAGVQVPLKITGDVPAGYLLTSPPPAPFTITSGVPVSGFNIGIFRGVQFNGYVFNDINGNGTFDAGETGIAGRTVQLVDGNLGVVRTTTTDANGYYTLSSGPGQFSVRALYPAGFTQSNANPAFTIVTSGLASPVAYFGSFQLLTISGSIFHDINGNGIREVGEGSLSGFGVNLVNSGGGVVAAVATDGNGNFTINGVGPGPFTLVQVPPAPWVVSTNNPIGLSPLSGQPISVTYGDYIGAVASGNVFEDLARNGIFDSNDPAARGVTVQILNSAGNVVISGLTDGNGNYSIAGIPPGSYRIRVVAPDGWVVTTPQPTPFSVTSGQAVAAAQVGVVRLGSLAGSIFQDGNRNGVRDLFETGLAGAIVQLNDGDGNLIGTQAADASGRYQFIGLNAGTYTAKLITIPAGYAISGPGATGTITVPVAVGSTNPNNAVSGVNFGIAGRKRYATAADGGGGPRVQVFDAATGNQISDTFVYEQTFTGGVRVASGDVNGDGVDDLAVVAGPGGGPRVRVIDGVTGRTLYDFFTYEPSFKDGMFIALGDVNGDGYADIVTGTAPGGGPRVTVYSGKDGTQLADYFAYDASFRGGVRVAVADVNGDGIAEIITSPGAGISAEVKVWGGGFPLSVQKSFLAFDPSYTGGAYVGGGAVSQDGRATIIVGSGIAFPGTPVVRQFDGVSGTNIFEAPAFQDPNYASEVRVSAIDRNSDGIPDIVIAAGPGSPPNVRFLDGRNRRQIGPDLQVFEASFLGGVFIG